MLRVILRIAAVFSFAFWICSCAGPPAEKMRAVNPLGWSAGDPAEIIVDNTDTTGMRTISILISYNHNFKDTRLPLEVTIISPDGKYFTEEFTMQWVSDRKKYLDYQESEIPYRQNVIFDKVGQYTFRISPMGYVEGVRAVGVKIE